MDLYRTIQILREERERLDRLITNLEQLKASEGVRPRRKPPGRRGRRHMSAAERKEISERMKRFWAARRPPAGSGEEALPEPSPTAASA